MALAKYNKSSKRLSSSVADDQSNRKCKNDEESEQPWQDYKHYLPKYKSDSVDFYSFEMMRLF